MTMMMSRSGGGGDRNGSVKEVLRQSMLQHEIAFRNQVRELHRLYWTQRNLMHELCRTVAAEEYGGETEGKECFLRPTRSQTVGSASTQKRTFDLQLPANLCIWDDGEEPVDERLEARGRTGDGLAVRLDSAELNHNAGEARLYAQGVIGMVESMGLESNMEVNGVSSSGPEALRNVSADVSVLILSSRAWGGSDLVPAESNSDARQSEGWREQKANYSSVGLKDSVSAPSINLSTENKISTSYKTMLIDLNIAQEDDPSHVLNDPVLNFPSPSMSSSVVQHGVLQRESINGCSKGTSAALQPDDTCLASSISGKKNADWLFHVGQDSHPCTTQASAQSTKVTGICWNHEHGAVNNVHAPDSKGTAKCCRNTTEGFSIGSYGALNRMNGIALSPAGLCKLRDENEDSLSGQTHSFVQSDSRWQASIVTFRNNIEHNNPHPSVGSSNLLPTVTGDADDKRANHEGSEEDTVSSHAIARDEDQQDGLSEVFPVQMSTQATGNNDCNAEDKIAERHKVLPISERSRTTRLDTSAPFPQTSDHICLQDKSFEQQQAQAAEMDCTITRAAETLVSISSEKSGCPSDHSASFGWTELEYEGRRDQPQYSVDSFESITLKLSEIRSDECVMSGSTEKETRQSACGVKLRRGRGLRDFQKDVLPGLVSLSRHEIHDDLHTIGYELRQNRSRKAYRDDWSVPVRRRRSRLCSVGRRG